MNNTDTHVEDLVRLLMDTLSDYQDLEQCMCSEDSGARLLSILNQRLSDNFKPFMQSIQALTDASIYHTKDSTLPVSTRRDRAPESA